MENPREDVPDAEEKPYITDIPTSRKPGRKFRSPFLKYGGGIIAVLGIFWTISAIAGSGTRVGRIFYVDSIPGLDVLGLPLLFTAVGILLYLFVDE